jgi:mannitol-1-phosphate 5-dehydrogenase
MAIVVQFGAGAIGRGFLGQLWAEAGYETVFVDVDSSLVDALNRHRSYPLSLVTNETTEHLTISPVRALSTRQTDAVLAALAECAFAAVSIGPHVFETIEHFFVPCLFRRMRQEPLNVVVAENDPEASATLTRLFQESVQACGMAGETPIAFVQAIVGRMVPKPGLPGNPLPVAAEPYKKLPVEVGKWLGEFPDVPGMFEQVAFKKYVEKKLYIHNAGHAALAYHGYRRGHEFIWQCAEDPDIISTVRGFWQEVNTFLHSAFLPLSVLTEFEDELISRFQNRVLGDTVVRVARDPIRKLHVTDRLVHPAIAYKQATGLAPVFILEAIAVALHFDYPDDPSAMHVQEAIRERGVGQAFVEIAHYPADDPAGLVPRIEAAYNAQSSAGAS